MGQKLGESGCALFSGGSWVPIEHKVAWAEAYLHTKRHLSPSSRLATTYIDRKLGGLCPFKGGEDGSPSNTMSVVWTEAYFRTKWHLDPCSHSAATDMGQKLGAVPLQGRGSWVPT